MPLCCNSRSLSKRDAAEAETRRARIVSILPPSGYNIAGVISGYTEQDPPPRYEEATQEARIPIISDEKPISLAQTDQISLRVRVSGEDNRSDVSSIVSIPSTQVTGITMAHTGTTIGRDLTGWTERTDSRPPSYYARSETGFAPSPSPSSESTGRILRHPVMQQDWRTWVEGMTSRGIEQSARR